MRLVSRRRNAQSRVAGSPRQHLERVLTACGATHSDDGPYKRATLEALEDARDNLVIVPSMHGLDSKEPVLPSHVRRDERDARERGALPDRLV